MTGSYQPADTGNIPQQLCRKKLGTQSAVQSLWLYSTSLEYRISRSRYLNKRIVREETNKDSPQEIYSVRLFRAAGNPPFPQKSLFQILFSMSHWTKTSTRFLDLVMRHMPHLLLRVYYQKVKRFTVKLFHIPYTPHLTLHCIRN